MAANRLGLPTYCLVLSTLRTQARWEARVGFGLGLFDVCP